jgi:hypothetical protein
MIDPQRSVRERDAKDYRYTDICTLYLLILGEAVQSCEGLVRGIELCDDGGEIPRTVLQMHAIVESAVEATGSNTVCVRVRPALQLTIIPWRKVRLGYQLLPESESLHTQTRYTQRLVEDMLVLPHNALLRRHFHNVPTLQEALVLLKLWLRLRGLSDGVNGWNGHLMSMLLLHLLTLGHIHSAHSSYQIFKITLHFIGTITLTLHTCMLLLSLFHLFCSVSFIVICHFSCTATTTMENEGLVMSDTLCEEEHRQHNISNTNIEVSSPLTFLNTFYLCVVLCCVLFCTRCIDKEFEHLTRNLIYSFVNISMSFFWILRDV